MQFAALCNKHCITLLSSVRRKKYSAQSVSVIFLLLFIPQPITTLIGWEDACRALNRIQPLAEGDLKWAEFVTVRWLASEL